MINDNDTFGFPTLLERRTYSDDRGFFSKLFSEEHMTLGGWFEVRQANISYTQHRGTIRGLHFHQDETKEAKILTVVTGKIFDVVLDVRPSSTEFGNHRTFVLDAKEPVSLYIPPGFAHGFQALVDEVLIAYIHSCDYVASDDRAVSALDASLSIEWPLAIHSMSERDRNAPKLSEHFENSYDLSSLR